MKSAVLRWFHTPHLPPHLQEVVEPFKVLALQLEDSLDPGGEKTKALDKLLEAKDAAVRAAIETKERVDASQS